jgi:hypothetical protein
VLVALVPELALPVEAGELDEPADEPHAASATPAARAATAARHPAMHRPPCRRPMPNFYPTSRTRPELARALRPACPRSGAR